MAKGGISKRKQTRNFLKSGQLSSQLEARQKRKTFKQKIKGRDAKRNKGVLPIHQREEEGGGSEEEFEEVKKKRKEREESEEFEEGLDVDGVLGAEGMGSDQGDEAGDDVSTNWNEPTSMKKLISRSLLESIFIGRRFRIRR